MLKRYVPSVFLTLIVAATATIAAAIVYAVGGPAWLAGLTFAAVLALGGLFRASAFPRFGRWQGAEHRHATLAEHAERLRVLHEIDCAILDGESPAAIAGRVIQPLRELLDVPRAVVNLFDLPSGQVEWLAAAGRKRVHVGPGVSYPLEFMGDIEALRRGEVQRVDTRRLRAGPEVRALLVSGVEEYLVVPMRSGTELIGAISFGGRDGHPFPRAKIGIAEEFAMQLAIVISQSRLRERVERHSEELEERVRERTKELEEVNRELETFSYSVSHDLRAPLRLIDASLEALLRSSLQGSDAQSLESIMRIGRASRRMADLIDDLMQLSLAGRSELKREPVDLSLLVRTIVSHLQAAQSERNVTIEIQEPLVALADPGLIRIALENLLGNAWKFTSRTPHARISFTATFSSSGGWLYSLSDNGAGFDMSYASKLFQPFQRLHTEGEFPGTGIGLATIHRIISRHGGTITAQGTVGAGATFSFTLGST